MSTRDISKLFEADGQSTLEVTVLTVNLLSWKEASFYGMVREVKWL